jgi:6-phosphogluconolactonase
VTTRTIHRAPTPEAANQTAARLVIELLIGQVRARGSAVLAVPGGSTPGPVLDALASTADASLLRAMTVTLVDERHLPGPATDDAPDTGQWPPPSAIPRDALADDHNTALLYRHLAHAEPSPMIVPWAHATDLETTRAWLEANCPIPGVVLLGMGPDGHVASLFPGHPAWTPGPPNLSGPHILSLTDSPKPPPARLTMSLDLLNQAHGVVIAVRGAAKAEAVKRALDGDPALATTHLSRPEVHWVLDPGAASLLEST